MKKLIDNVATKKVADALVVGVQDQYGFDLEIEYTKESGFNLSITTEALDWERDRIYHFVLGMKKGLQLAQNL